MKKKIKIPDAIGARTEYKRKFSFGEMYRAFVLIPGAAFRLMGNRRKKLISKEFVERLQLAVTEVNGCAACSFADTYMTLKQGMSNEEIYSFLSGDSSFIHQEEARAIAFAQHYADTRALPKKEAYKTLVDTYGTAKVKVIVAAIQVMHAGNIFGIPYSALISRMKGKPYKESSLFYELGMHLSGVLLFPLAMFHGTVKNLFTPSELHLVE